MSKRFLLPESDTFYKANLHCHSTMSDGRLTPAEIKEQYSAHGYSAVAFTDHEYLTSHPELRTPDFLPLKGYEISVSECGHPDFNHVPTYHLNLFALDPENETHVCFHPGNCWGVPKEIIPTLKYAGSGEYYRRYSVEGVNEIIKEAHEHGFLVSYNHPAWSLQKYDDYAGLKGLDFIEVYNHGCVVTGNSEYEDQAMDDLLRNGNRLYCVCTDDNHNHDNDSFGGWVMIKAPALEYGEIMNALKAGNFYASTGAEITAFYAEGNTVTVECPPSKAVRFITGCRHAALITGDKPVTSASFTANPGDMYVRAEVISTDGKKAFTQPYYID